MNPSNPTNQTRNYVLEQRQPFSASLLWQLQRDYFEDMGAAAWQSGQVPHYVSSSPALASSYAEIIFALWRDCRRLAAAAGQADGAPAGNERLCVCELGAGSGRFAFHFLTRFVELCQMAQFAEAPLRYVLTDFTQSNLDFWIGHPRFAAFFEEGLLDVALFDMNEANRLELQMSKETISAGDLSYPLVVFANYVFDSIPQDLYYIANGQWFPICTTLYAEHDPATLEPGQRLAHVQIAYSHQPPLQQAAIEPAWRELFQEYGRLLDRCHVLLPTAAQRCLQRLQALSAAGLVLLAADKGSDQPDKLAYKPLTGLVRHGSFSLPVNFHALRWMCERRGGRALFAGHAPQSIQISCLLLLDQPESYIETCAAYRRCVSEYGPDDYYAVARICGNQAATLQFADIMACLRLSRYDARQFLKYWPRLVELAPDFNEHEQATAAAAAARVWNGYFPLGEDNDMAYRLAAFMYEMGEYRLAIGYFEQSIAIYGEHSGTLYNMAVCYELLADNGQAEHLLKKVLTHDPSNEAAETLLRKLLAQQSGTL